MYHVTIPLAALIAAGGLYGQNPKALRLEDIAEAMDSSQLPSYVLYASTAKGNVRYTAYENKCDRDFLIATPYMLTAFGFEQSAAYFAPCGVAVGTYLIERRKYEDGTVATMPPYYMFQGISGPAIVRLPKEWASPPTEYELLVVPPDMFSRRLHAVARHSVEGIEEASETVNPGQPAVRAFVVRTRKQQGVGAPGSSGSPFGNGPLQVLYGTVDITERTSVTPDLLVSRLDSPEMEALVSGAAYPVVVKSADGECVTFVVLRGAGASQMASLSPPSR